jgi:hypothetical protein
MMDRVIPKDLARGRIVAPGNPEAPHAWVYLPDVARAAVALSDLRDLPRFADIPSPGTPSASTTLLPRSRQTGRTPRIAAFPGWQLRLAAPFRELARALLAMRYLRHHPYGLDGAARAALAPGLRQTALTRIVAACRAPAATSARAA